MKKIAILEIKGGLGNQLFILNFIDFLEQNNFKVYSITNFYETGFVLIQFYLFQRF